MTNDNVNEKLTALADEIRELSSTTDKLGIDEMTETLNVENAALSSNLTIQDNIITQLEQAIAGKAIDSNGCDTSDATARADDILLGKTAYVKGQKITGNIAFAPVKTITPSTASQIVVSSGHYVAEDITVVGDTNLVASNIKKGVNIFGVDGNYEGKATGQNALINFITEGTIDLSAALVNKISVIGLGAFAFCSTLESASFPVCTHVQSCAFYSCSKLTAIDLPVCTSLDYDAFYQCQKLISVNMPVCSYLGTQPFWACEGLTSVSFPNCSYMGYGAFGYCYKLVTADFGENAVASSIGRNAFYKCSQLTSLILRYSSVIALQSTDAFNSTPMSISTITGYFGSIYVPASLVNAYKIATNWIAYSNRITAISDS